MKDFKNLDRRAFIRIGTLVGLSPSLLLAMEKNNEFLVDFLKNKKDPIKLIKDTKSLLITKHELKKCESKIHKYHKLINKKEKRTIVIKNIHTCEKTPITYKTGLIYNIEEIRKFNYIMRDFREDKMTRIDPSLLDVLYAIQNKLNKHDTVYLLSGYRTKKTNNLLRRTGHNAAKNSFHIKGKAMDIALPSVSETKVASVARSLHLGGVGEYRSSHFTHIDVGPIRHWRG